MEASLYSQIIAQYFSPVIGQITEKFNDENHLATYLHKTMLDNEYSADMTWGSTDINNSVVAADVVSMDSSLPLKRRPSMSNAKGTICKVGMKKRLGEKEQKDIKILMSQGNKETEIVRKLSNDDAAVVAGVLVRNEIMFRSGLSSGLSLATDANDTKVGVRVSFGYKDGHTITPSIKWGASNFTPVTDLTAMFDTATDEQDSINHVYIQKKYFNLLRKSQEGKELAAYANNLIVTSKTQQLPTPSRSAFLSILQDEFGATFHIVEGKFRLEHPDGSWEDVDPWEDGMVVGVPSEKVGRLVYSDLVEEDAPVDGVQYAKSDYILVSKYRNTDPFEEFTASQALCLPVIDGGSHIYRINTQKTA